MSINFDYKYLASFVIAGESELIFSTQYSMMQHFLLMKMLIFIRNTIVISRWIRWPHNAAASLQFIAFHCISLHFIAFSLHLFNVTMPNRHDKTTSFTLVGISKQWYYSTGIWMEIMTELWLYGVGHEILWLDSNWNAIIFNLAVVARLDCNGSITFTIHQFVISCCRECNCKDAASSWGDSSDNSISSLSVVIHSYRFDGRFIIWDCVCVLSDEKNRSERCQRTWKKNAAWMIISARPESENRPRKYIQLFCNRDLIN